MPHGDDLYHVLLALAAVIVVGRVLGFVCRWLHQPPVIGEVVAGILLGPSLLVWLAPEAYAYLLPPRVGPLLQVIAQLGVILYMFLVGLELNTGMLRECGRTAIVVSQAGIYVPLAIGAGFAFVAHRSHSPPDVPVGVFALFVGVAMSITAFPVLARILTDRGISQSPLGSIALVSAAIGDAVAWCLLALAVGIADSRIHGALWTVLLTAAYIAIMWLLVRPLMARLVSRHDGATGLSQTHAASLFVALLISALVSEWIGIHALFGAFLLGAVVPHDSRLAREFIHRLQDLVQVLLLPAFFAYTGMRTQIGLISGWNNVLWCLALIAVATLGKIGGSAVAARWCGQHWRDACALGVLMNARGLMELIVLNIGLELGVISPTLFAMMVLMALATTIATTPMLDLLRPHDADQPIPATAP